MKAYATLRPDILEDKNYRDKFTLDKEYPVVTEFSEEIGSATAKVGLIDDHGHFHFMQTEQATFRLVDDIAEVQATLLKLLEAFVHPPTNLLVSVGEIKRAGDEQNKDGADVTAVNPGADKTGTDKDE